MMGLAEPFGVKPVPFHELLWIVIASQCRTGNRPATVQVSINS